MLYKSIRYCPNFLVAKIKLVSNFWKLLSCWLHSLLYGLLPTFDSFWSLSLELVRWPQDIYSTSWMDVGNKLEKYPSILSSRFQVIREYEGHGADSPQGAMFKRLFSKWVYKKFSSVTPYFYNYYNIILVWTTFYISLIHFCQQHPYPLVLP